MPRQPSPETQPTLDPVTEGGAASTQPGASPTATRTKAPLDAAPIVPGYELGDLIGRGGMGDVYRARDLELDREVAVKILQKRFGADTPGANRFVAEARITGQLQHPGIPAVYRVARLADGRPFLAMKLIKGQTLEDLLQTDTQLNSLALIEAVAQALGFAHAHGVIHRDVKPGNVMVGPFGEVQVMDWGLAKVVAARSDRAQAESPATDRATTMIRPGHQTDHTQHGSILGTPAYMPPEQAAGETDRIGPASDVFGVGALWCTLLTGAPPFEGSDVDSVRHNAMHGKTDAALARLDRCGAAPDVAALCKQCLEFEPAKRPADGNVVARRVAELRVAAEERARQAELLRARAEVQTAEQSKRRRVLVIAAAVVGLVLLGGLGVSLGQMFRAMQAETLARKNEKTAQEERDAKNAALEAEKKAREDETQARQQAFVALRSMTDGVVERKFAQGVVLTEDDKDFLRGVIQQFDAFAALQGNDAESRAVRAEGRYRVGTIHLKLGELRQAEQAFDAAMGLYQQLVNDFPDRTELRMNLGLCHNTRSVVRRAKARLPEAAADVEEALVIFQKLAADVPSKPEYRKELAQTHNNRGVIRRGMGRMEEAERAYDEALQIRKQLVADFPTRSDFRRELASTHFNRANLLNATKRPKEAEQHYGVALELYQQLVADFPTRHEFRQELAMCHNNRGLLLVDVKQIPAAEKDYAEGLRTYKQLAAEFPTKPEFRLNLTKGHLNRGILLLDTGRLQEAQADYAEALRIARPLAADFPEQPDMRNVLAGACACLADVQHQQGNWAAAKALLQEGQPHHLAVLKANAKNSAFRWAYGKHLAVLTAVHAGLLERDEAIRTAGIRRDVNWEGPEDAYVAASALSRCVPIVSKHPALDEAQQQEAARFYADAATKMLGEAVSKGYRDAAQFKKDTDLDPLRQRDDFRKIIAELESKAK